MFTLRCTQRLLRRLNVPGEGADQPPTTRLGDWYANLLHIGSRQVILATSERSLLGLFLSAARAATLPERLRLAVAQLLEDLGVPQQLIAEESAAMAEVRIGYTRDRRVLGTMNDLASQVRWRLEDDPGGDLGRLQRDLTLMPCGAIGYASSGERTAELFGLTWSHQTGRFL